MASLLYLEDAAGAAAAYIETVPGNGPSSVEGLDGYRPGRYQKAVP